MLFKTVVVREDFPEKLDATLFSYFLRYHRVVPFSMVSGMLIVNSAVDAAALGERQGSFTHPAIKPCSVSTFTMNGKELEHWLRTLPSGNRNLSVTLILGEI